ncbi:hypothetical protein [Caulobacter sp. S45]|uniref:hypothetical protein n=1 Tax=Caulobacter sp. S45 TaxID=1641861 RepID=UPI001576FB16|nr:hypothetical protein [Caulobacter sp. S45]
MSSPIRSAEFDPTPVLLAAALAIGVAVQVLLPGAPSSTTSLHPLRLGRAGRIMPAPALPAYPAIAARPLFTPGRAAQASVTPDVAPAGSFSLLGAASSGRGASAVLRSQDAGVHVVGLGESLLGWRLVAVTHDGAVVSRGGATQLLRVGAPPLQPATAAVPAAGVPR